MGLKMAYKCDAVFHIALKCGRFGGMNLIHVSSSITHNCSDHSCTLALRFRIVHEPDRIGAPLAGDSGSLLAPSKHIHFITRSREEV